MSKTKLTKEQRERMAQGVKDFTALKRLISPFVKKKKIQQSATRGRWLDGQLANQLPSDLPSK